MESLKSDGKRVVRERGIKKEGAKVEEYGSDDVEEEEPGGGDGGGGEGETEVGADDERKRRGSCSAMRRGAGVGGSSLPCCQVDKCTADLAESKRYHRRHKVCELHSKAPVVVVAGLRQRFCQQCSRFHELQEFDEAKRSCRRRLAGHNERRRKSSSETHASIYSALTPISAAGSPPTRHRLQVFC
ncbi:hypothetical protein Nepgr_026788 [Nepenthes gracilis]|uniref:SBP-type domain-containing protein n=1 Tax=Nepenthes gracilis TaxID=150966 RepID=A0AAD3Y2C9_NEPGR|nr:hypothetical protein Nepgr_026788 [Nepenthes gracilis]